MSFWLCNLQQRRSSSALNLKHRLQVLILCILACTVPVQAGPLKIFMDLFYPKGQPDLTSHQARAGAWVDQVVTCLHGTMLRNKASLRSRNRVICMWQPCACSHAKHFHQNLGIVAKVAVAVLSFLSYHWPAAYTTSLRHGRHTCERSWLICRLHSTFWMQWSWAKKSLVILGCH